MRHPLYSWLDVSEDGEVYSHALGRALTNTPNSHGHIITHEVHDGTNTSGGYHVDNRYYVAALVADTYLEIPPGELRYTMVPDVIDGSRSNIKLSNLKWRSLVEKRGTEVHWESIPVTLVDYVDMTIRSFPSKGLCAQWGRENLPTGKSPEISYSPAEWRLIYYGRYQVVRTGFDDIVPPDKVVSSAMCLVDIRDGKYSYRSSTTLAQLERIYTQTARRLFDKALVRMELITRRGQKDFVVKITDTIGACYVTDILAYNAIEGGKTEFTDLTDELILP